MKTKHLFQKTLLATGIAFLLAGCGGTEEEESQEASVETRRDDLLAACTDTEELTEVAEHACVHGDLGPFQPVTAAPLGTASFVDVSAPHTAYVLTLPARTDAWGWGGSVIFTPEESTEYAFLLSRQRALRIFNAATGQEVARECRFQVPEEVCTSLRTLVTADLEAGVDYRLEFKALARRNATFTLVIEETAHDHSEE